MSSLVDTACHPEWLDPKAKYHSFVGSVGMEFELAYLSDLMQDSIMQS